MERKNLADYFADGGAKGNSFITPQGEVYTCLDIIPSDENDSNKNLKILKGDLEEIVDIDSHLKDPKVDLKLTPEKFYESVLTGKVFFYDGKNLIDTSKNNSDPSKVKGLRIIEDEAEYIRELDKKAESLYRQKTKTMEISDFMKAVPNYLLERDYLHNEESAFEEILEEELLPKIPELGDTEILIPELEDTAIPLSEPEDMPLLQELDNENEPEYSLAEDNDFDDVLAEDGDPNLSGSALLDLSLQADDTSLGGILDEIYNDDKNNQNTGEDLDLSGSGSGLLDLALQADDTGLGGILDEIYNDEIKNPNPDYQNLKEIPLELEPELKIPEASDSYGSSKKTENLADYTSPKQKRKRGRFGRAWGWFWDGF